MSMFFLLLVIVSFTDITQSSLYGQQLRQYFHDIYAPLNEERKISPRNIPTLTGSGVFQEPSSRDLDVGFAVGVKDEGEATDVLINNHSSKTYSPTVSEFPSSATYVVQEPSASKEVNIGVYVDPKNGVKYYAPGFIPSSGRPNVYEFPPERYVPSVVPAVGQMYPLLAPNQQYPMLNSYQQPLSSYPLHPQSPNYLSRYPSLSPNVNTMPYPYQINPNVASVPPNSFSTSVPILEQTVLSKFPNIYRYQREDFPYQDYYQQPPDVDGYSGIPYDLRNLQFFPSQIPETLYRSAMTANVYDDGVSQGRFARSHGRFPYRNSDFRHKIPFKNFQNVFQVQEQFPRESYGHFAQPVVVREETQAPEIVVDQQGIPVMTAQPYGERQVGAFKLRNDHGYQVTMNVPPVPGDGPTDGVLVMEMKANLYRPLS